MAHPARPLLEQAIAALAGKGQTLLSPIAASIDEALTLIEESLLLLPGAAPGEGERG